MGRSLRRLAAVRRHPVPVHPDRGHKPGTAGLDEFVDRVVPLLQGRGSLRAGYTGTTLRDNLGIPVPVPGASAAVA
jgi:hypothetical protein